MPGGRDPVPIGQNPGVEDAPTTIAERPGAHGEAMLVEDEARRTHAFMAASAALAVVGSAATWLFDGDPALRLAFVGGVLWLLGGYLWLWWQTRQLSNYHPAKAVAAITVTNLAGVLACGYYGFFSPAPIILMLPIAYIGRSGSGAAAYVAYTVAAGSMAVPMFAIAAGWTADPGLVTAAELTGFEQALYACLVQAVFLVCLLNGRASQRATLAATRSLEGAQRRMLQQEAQLAEAQERINWGAGGGKGPLTGSRLGDWTLRDLLGRGAMGDVYAARREADALDGAIEVLNPVAASDPKAIALMRREAELLRGMSSPHVVRLLEVVTEGLPWIAMERLRGDDLAAILRRDERMPVADVLRMVQEVAQGLDAAAATQVLHRDLEPSNIFRAQAGDRRVWKLLDFGVAKRLGQDLTLTTGDVLGTPGYIPPEALTGGPVDPRGDVFSLAAVTYRALTGARPFRGRGHALLISTLEDMPERPSRWPGVPEPVDAVLAVALAKEPGGRFATAGGFADALAGALQGTPSLAVAERAGRVLAARPWGSRRLKG